MTIMKLEQRRKILIPLFSIFFFLTIMCSVSNAQENKASSEQQVDIKAIIELTATVIGIGGGLFGLYKYFSDQREKELREWQKVIIYKIFRQEEQKSLSFGRILEKYRSEGLATPKFNLKKEEINEYTLRRILLELTSSGILTQFPSDSFKLEIQKTFDIEKANLAFFKKQDDLIDKNKFTIREVAIEMWEFSKSLGDEIPISRIQTDIRQGIKEGYYKLNENGCIGFSDET